ncbi:MAG: hypothetical protein JW717_12575 [Marinilabiliaceae bacterium]|nr:hypothetical protein [Marinilabiliaceae bacterium]
MKHVKIIGTLLLCLNIYIGTAQTVNIRGIDIPLNEIPFNRAYQIKENNLKSAKVDTTKGKPHTAFASRHKNRIAVASSQDVVRKNVALETKMVKETTLEMYNKKGKLKWKTQMDNYIPLLGSISEKTNRSNFVWYSSSEDADNRILALYDSNGNEVFTDEYMGNIFPFTDDNHEIVFYTKDPYLSNNNDDASTLYCYNTTTKSRWSKMFDSSKPFAIVGVPGNGTYVLCGLVSLNNNDGSTLYCLSNKGEFLWKKEFQENLGNFSITSNGANFLRIVRDNKWELYNKDGLQVRYNSVAKIEGNNFNPYNGCFVKNMDSVVSIVSYEINQSKIAFFNYNGLMLDYLQVPNTGNYFVEFMPDGKFYIFFDDKKIIEYKPIWLK